MNLFERLVVWFLPPSKNYNYAMMKAIDKARQPVWIGGQCQSKADGLRVIRRFEKVNKTAFNPFSEEHLEFIAGNASHEQFFRKAGYVFDSIITGGKDYERPRFVYYEKLERNDSKSERR